MRTCARELALRSEPVVYVTDACAAMEMSDSAISATASFRGAPVRTDAIVRLRTACLEVLTATIGWQAFRCATPVWWEQASQTFACIGWRRCPSMKPMRNAPLYYVFACRDADSVPHRDGGSGDSSLNLARLRERLLKASEICHDWATSISARMCMFLFAVNARLSRLGFRFSSWSWAAHMRRSSMLQNLVSCWL